MVLTLQLYIICDTDLMWWFKIVKAISWRKVKFLRSKVKVLLAAVGIHYFHYCFDWAKIDKTTIKASYSRLQACLVAAGTFNLQPWSGVRSLRSAPCWHRPSARTEASLSCQQACPWYCKHVKSHSLELPISATSFWWYILHKNFGFKQFIHSLVL